MQTEADFTFSVIVPTYNRPARVRECLAALCELDYPKDKYEVVIVDDGGDDPLDGIEAAHPSGTKVRLLRQESAGPASARNYGAREARGRFLAFTDDDCCPSPGWLVEFERRLLRSPDAMVGGTTLNRLTGNLFSEASETLLQALYAFSNLDPENGRFLASNNIGLSRRLFHEVGGFDANFPLAAAEDRDFCDRWTHAGRRLLWAPEAVVLHSHEHTLRSFLRQHFNYGRGAVLYQRLRSRRGSGGLKDDVGFHLQFFRWLRGPLSRHNPGRALVLIGLVMLTQVAYLWGYLFERMHPST
jgi:glycosyltransferase involved in cell wall biosynthesis